MSSILSKVATGEDSGEESGEDDERREGKEDEDFDRLSADSPVRYSFLFPYFPSDIYVPRSMTGHRHLRLSSLSIPKRISDPRRMTTQISQRNSRSLSRRRLKLGKWIRRLLWLCGRLQSPQRVQGRKWGKRMRKMKWKIPRSKPGL